MVIGDDEVGIGGGRHSFLAKRSLRQAHPRFVPCWAIACKHPILSRLKAVNPRASCAMQYAKGEADPVSESARSARYRCGGPKVVLGEASRRCYRRSKP